MKRINWNVCCCDGSCRIDFKFRKLCARADVFAFLYNGCLVEAEACAHGGICRAVSNQKVICAFLHDVACALLIIGHQIRCLKGKRNLSAFGRLQLFCLGKCHKLLVRLIQLFRRFVHIELNDLFSFVCTCILHRNFYRYFFFIRGDRRCAEFKLCIRKTISKWEGRCDVRGVEITIAYINSLGIHRIIHISEPFCRRI